VVEGQQEALKREGMVFTRAARLRWEKVADYLYEIVQYILEVDSLYMEYELVLVWHATLCQTMEYPTVPILAQSLYDVIVSMRFEEDLEFEFAVNYLSRWMEPILGGYRRQHLSGALLDACGYGRLPFTVATL
jgi:hypothetical protein